ncbi:MAG: hypothetical protein IJ019_01985 [Alphaproteobacteria bacterium]|nr:hypothetical protein [Alphaproteobacteria bacterium]
MKNSVLKTSKKGQIMICVVVGLVLIATILFLNFKTTNRFEIVKKEIISLSESIRDSYKSKPDYRGLNTESVAEIAPQELKRKNKIVSSIGREFIVGQDENGSIIMPSQRVFMISINNLSKKSCEQIAVLNILENNLYGLQKVIIKNSDYQINFELGGEYPLPITEENADKFCKNKNTVSWVFE